VSNPGLFPSLSSFEYPSLIFKQSLDKQNFEIYKAISNTKHTCVIIYLYSLHLLVLFQSLKVCAKSDIILHIHTHIFMWKWWKGKNFHICVLRKIIPEETKKVIIWDSRGSVNWHNLDCFTPFTWTQYTMFWGFIKVRVSYFYTLRKCVIKQIMKKIHEKCPKTYNSNMY
jgi:hypothetical protein